MGQSWCDLTEEAVSCAYEAPERPAPVRPQPLCMGPELWLAWGVGGRCLPLLFLWLGWSQGVCTLPGLCPQCRLAQHW